MLCLDNCYCQIPMGKAQAKSGTADVMLHSQNCSPSFSFCPFDLNVGSSNVTSQLSTLQTGKKGRGKSRYSLQSMDRERTRFASLSHDINVPFHQLCPVHSRMTSRVVSLNCDAFVNRPPDPALFSGTETQDLVQLDKSLLRCKCLLTCYPIEGHCPLENVRDQLVNI